VPLGSVVGLEHEVRERTDLDHPAGLVAETAKHDTACTRVLDQRARAVLRALHLRRGFVLEQTGAALGPELDRPVAYFAPDPPGTCSSRREPSCSSSVTAFSRHRFFMTNSRPPAHSQ
jgi:hypothetical protein